MGRGLMQSPHFHSCFFELWNNCGTVEKKATKSSTTVVVYVYTTVVVTVDQVRNVVDELWGSVGR